MMPRPDDELRQQYEACKSRGVNFLLDVPPDNTARSRRCTWTP
jgi:hypothetical protein